MVDNDIVLTCRDVHHWFDKPVLYSVDLEVARGQIVGLVGPSGCGKSTLLRAITGTHPPKRGCILVRSHKSGGKEMDVRSLSRDIGIVYQHYSLFPFLTAVKNVAFGLMLDESGLADRALRWRWWRSVRKRHVEEASELLAKFGLGDALDRYPHELSGGMRQRVAIAQAVIMKPEIILLDEPFGALDTVTRAEMQQMLLRLYAENMEKKNRGEKPSYTVLMVTHELQEALYVGDRVVGLSQYWNWRAEGYDSCPGATIVYDKPAPVYRPADGMDQDLLLDQCNEIRQMVFDPEFVRKREEFKTYWELTAAGQGGGPTKP